jgi:hypothetical protein
MAFRLSFEKIGKRTNISIEITVRGAKGVQSLNIPMRMLNNEPKSSIKTLSNIDCPL